jgi:hypothetical protein
MEGGGSVRGSLRSPGTGTLNDPSRNLHDDLVLLDLVRLTEGGHWPELFGETPMKINDAVSRAENEVEIGLRAILKKLGSALKKQKLPGLQASGRWDWTHLRYDIRKRTVGIGWALDKGGVFVSIHPAGTLQVFDRVLMCPQAPFNFRQKVSYLSFSLSYCLYNKRKDPGPFFCKEY